MLNQAQIDAFARDGVPGVPDLLPPRGRISGCAEYAAPPATFHDDRRRAGRVPLPGGQRAIADGHPGRVRARPSPVGAGGAVMSRPLTPCVVLNDLPDRFRRTSGIRRVTGQPVGRAHLPRRFARPREKPKTQPKGWHIRCNTGNVARAHLSDQPHNPIHRWRADSPACA
ncbi:hypothetical protein C8N32_11428 [Rhodovulum imhoffii]|uniref:Uncharacterized protein n=2 Tax=Rhodovulum imhoffii TaxID=365340 RepID=A0A2T5BQE9_9RHOB|nr:hypothetical protein [Rhodovulum imhoffii]MBK5933691.1 hypothetical protein [Rhodovulum imhoffii]PTN01329.1 hypothetical protein C8N32_11428 [Rhodovulum imhoffii]